jgi:hypothetical protein
MIQQGLPFVKMACKRFCKEVNEDNVTHPAMQQPNFSRQVSSPITVSENQNSALA